MSESERTKRRKIREEINILHNVYSHSASRDNLNINTQVSTTDQTKQQLGPNCIPCSSAVEIGESSVLFSSLSSSLSYDHSNLVTHPEQSTYLSSSIISKPVTPSHSSDNTSDHYPDYSIQNFLASWAVEYNIPHNAVNGLLKGLKKHECFNYLPADCRTILKTPSSASKHIRKVEPGLYHHFGLANGIKLNLPSNVDEVKIAIGIDGLPISKSSSNQFWPILAYIKVESPLPKQVFLVGLYYGTEKPHCSNDFLLDFVEEAKELTSNGILINSVKINVIINVFCCDSPAKSFILKVKGHSGFSSCTRCKIEGEYIDHRVCFPYTRVMSTSRDHNSYINTLDEDFHVYDTISNLAELPNFDAVYSFSLDYLHLVNIGVMKKLLMLWVNKGPLNIRIRARKIDELSNLILKLNSYITSDFVRKGRSIQELSRWKATEHRFFLLYTGPIVLKNIITEACYTNFMTLNIAMLILLSPNCSFLVDFAKELLDFFVMSFQKIYGQQFVSHNVHGLLHICDDYLRYGPLDNCSTFVFENFMKELKSFLRKHDKPLQQVINRYNEKYFINLNNGYKGKIKQLLEEKPVLKNQHTNGPLPEHLNGIEYYTLLYKTIKIKIQDEKNSYILTKNKDIVKCLNFCLRDDGNIIIIGQKFKIKSAFYETPINSTILDIFVVQKLSDKIKCWTEHDIKKKMMIFVHESKYIAMPVIHTDI